MKQFIFSAIAVLFSVSIFAQGYKPSVKLTVGKKYEVASNTKGNMSQEMMGQTMEIPMDVTIKSILDVKAAAKAGYQLSTVNNHMLLSVSMMGQDINYDSDKKEDRNGELGKTFEDMLDKPTIFDINNYGKIIESSILKSSATKTDPNPIFGMLNIGEQAILSPAVNLFNTDAEIKIGDSFTDSSTSADGKDKKSLTYTLVEIKDGQAKFAIAGLSMLTKEMEMQGMQSTTTSNSKIKGEMWVNSVTGLLTKKEVAMEISGSVALAGMTIPTTGVSNITIVVKEVE
jgi:hypothetical protein